MNTETNKEQYVCSRCKTEISLKDFETLECSRCSFTEFEKISVEGQIYYC